MRGRAADLSYRFAAVQEASPAGLAVIVYDLLVDDLRHAAAAMRRGDIEERSRRLKHGLLALQVLEGSLDHENGGAGIANLARLYAHIRRQILQAQFLQDPRILEQQISLLLDVREAWRTVDILAAVNARAAAASANLNSSNREAATHDAADWSA
ncbi:MAG TPA: flagellar export chaperone FliS [Candidatus Angelobacter sp.]|nr:flagellar export chaperone FliS [Candidatus Angelobacter sp.]